MGCYLFCGCRGQSIRVPHNVEGVLAFRYGPTWRTPLYMDKGVDTGEGAAPNGTFTSYMLCLQ